jgi:Tfp pilus assembly protein PilV
MKRTPVSLMQDQRGIALITVLLLALVATVFAMTAALIMTNTSLTTRYSERAGRLEALADAGIEEARSRINGNSTLYPESLFTTLENGVTPTDAGGASVSGVRRWTYVGPTGVTSGQYGIFGSIVSVTEDASGNRVVRRREVQQESFAKFAYFTDIEPSNISFGGGDQIWGPVHTNDLLKIYSSGAWFHGSVATALTVQGAQYGTFDQGYTENAAYIPMPQTADLTKLATQAQAGGTYFVSSTSGTAGQATMRIQFTALDLNSDGDSTDANEGFIRVYSSGDPNWVVAGRPSDYSTNGLRNSVNCGHTHANGAFVNAANHVNPTGSGNPPTTPADNWVAALSNVGRRCYLGGSDSLWGSFRANDGAGQWLTWGGAVSGLIAGRPDGAYLFPISRALNPSFKGVIYVQGNVAISGMLRGQVTVAATGNIVIADDMIYATNPAGAACSPDKDMLGLFAGGNVLMADNTINPPVRPRSSANYFTYDDTQDEFVHAVVLTLNIFTVENFATGATTAERCGSTLWGRGCLYLTGGIIQRQRGAVGTITSPGGTGYLKRYAYDACAASYPPPYFPTTGHFSRGRYFEVDPTNFSATNYFGLLTAN